jgi:hypothetical protein
MIDQETQFTPNFRTPPTPVQQQATIAGSYGEWTWPRHLAVYFRHNDGGRSCSKRPKQKSDCTVCAVAIAFGMPYDCAYDLLRDAGRKCSRGFAFHDWARRHPNLLEWISFPAVKGQTRMNPAKFCNQFRSGAWICRSAKHVFAVIDGVIQDTSAPSPGRCIYGAYHVVANLIHEADIG